MTWGPLPMDLDLHVMIYSEDNSTDCEVYFGNMDCPDVNLDLDNTSGGNNGPETITVFDYDPDQTYMIFVHDFHPDSQHTMSKSGAKVTIYSPLLSNPEVVMVPNNGGSELDWLIGCIQGQDGIASLKIINQLMNIDPADNLSLCQ